MTELAGPGGWVEQHGDEILDRAVEQHAPFPEEWRIASRSIEHASEVAPRHLDSPLRSEASRSAIAWRTARDRRSSLVIGGWNVTLAWRSTAAARRRSVSNVGLFRPAS